MNPEMAIGIVVGLLRWKRKSLERVRAAVAFVDTKEKDQFEVVLRGSKRKPYLFKADIRMFTKRKGGGDSQGYTRGHWVHAFEEHISYAKSLAAYRVVTSRCFDQDK